MDFDGNCKTATCMLISDNGADFAQEHLQCIKRLIAECIQHSHALAQMPNSPKKRGLTIGTAATSTQQRFDALVAT